MNPLLATEESRYSLKTLQALHYGAIYSGVSRHGLLRVTFTDGEGLQGGNVSAIAASSVHVRTEEGVLDVKPGMILHAEVV